MREFLDELTDTQAAQVLAAMRTVAEVGLVEARHLRGDVYEVRASIGGQAFRVFQFAKRASVGRSFWRSKPSKRSRTARRLERLRSPKRDEPTGVSELVLDLLLDISFLR